MSGMQASVVLGDRRYALRAIQSKAKADGSTNTYYAYVPSAVPSDDRLGSKTRMGFPVKRDGELPEVAVFELPGQTVRVVLSRGMSPAVDVKTGKAKRSYPQVKGNVTEEVKALGEPKRFNVTISATHPGIWNVKVSIIGISAGGGRNAFEDEGEVVSSAQLKKLASL